jgi:DNA-binding winged helix-turn-helix (wHTH) protein
LPPKAFAVLHYLVTHPNHLVTKDELLDAVWPETAITDAVVRVTIGTLRKVLGDTAQTPRCIATVPRRGYRFLTAVALAHASEPPVPPTPHLLSPPLSRRCLLDVRWCSSASGRRGRKRARDTARSCG